MTARVLMVQGTHSSAGKSLLVAGLCRVFAQEGLRVAPFKAQNMALNSFVTSEGLEIGRAQVVQAQAAGIAPHVDMNPVLLKPEGDAHCQVVVNGRPWQELTAMEYYERKGLLWEAVTAALDRLRSRYDLIVIEGAGSPAEINLRAGDIVNMAVALHAQAPVLLVGDIDRGGVFASLLGTLMLLQEDERRMVRGLIINKFRGDIRLLQDGLDMLEARAGVPVLGVVHYLHQLHIAEEDSVALDEPVPTDAPGSEVDIAVVRLPRISNFDDFDALALEPGVRVRYVTNRRDLGLPSAVILPGTKATISDLAWLRMQGLADAILNLARQGAAVTGICGGYQMLGQTIIDSEGAESDAGSELPGLGLLPVVTEFVAAKTTHQVAGVPATQRGFMAAGGAAPLDGYEIHMGQSRLLAGNSSPLLKLTSRSGAPVEEVDGAIDPSGRIWGTYLHGLFDNTAFRRAWLASLGWTAPDSDLNVCATREAEYDRIAAALRSSLNMEAIREIAGLA